MNTKDDDWILKHSDTISNSISSEKPMLELGCGSGRDTLQLEKFGVVVATDISSDALQAHPTQSSNLICLDISKTLPFSDRSFCLVLASLSLHYFSWNITESITREIKRVLIEKGILIVRLNSINDVNYGAASGEEIESNFYRIEDRTKRFFDHESIEKLFPEWKIIEASEQVIDRYEKPKFIWELVLNVV